MRQTILLFLLIGTLACTDKKLAEVERLTDEVIDIHDKMMPLMDDMYLTRQALQKAADADSLQSATYTASMQRIADAESAMMTWMNNFNPLFRGASHEETMDYLKEQKKTMQAVADQMTDALKEGKAKLPK